MLSRWRVPQSWFLALHAAALASCSATGDPPAGGGWDAPPKLDHRRARSARYTPPVPKHLRCRSSRREGHPSSRCSRATRECGAGANAARGTRPTRTCCSRTRRHSKVWRPRRRSMSAGGGLVWLRLARRRTRLVLGPQHERAGRQWGSGRRKVRVARPRGGAAGRGAGRMRQRARLRANGERHRLVLGPSEWPSRPRPLGRERAAVCCAAGGTWPCRRPRRRLLPHVCRARRRALRLRRLRGDPSDRCPSVRADPLSKADPGVHGHLRAALRRRSVVLHAGPRAWERRGARARRDDRRAAARHLDDGRLCVRLDPGRQNACSTRGWAGQFWAPDAPDVREIAGRAAPRRLGIGNATAFACAVGRCTQCWGDNVSGNLGDGNTDDSYDPVVVRWGGAQ